MTNTQRSASELLAFFADNTIGAITPQMVRDLVVSCRPLHGALHFTDPGSPTTVSQASTFVKAGNTADLYLADTFSQPVSGRLRYDGRVPVHCRIIFSGSVSLPGSNNEIVRLAVALNGVPLVPSITRTKLGSQNDTQAIGLNVEVELAPGDYLELWLANDSGAHNVTVEHGYLSALAFLA